MRAIKVTFRAVFSGPLAPINPSGWPMKGQFPVEIFGNGEHWKAREIATPARQVYTKLMDFANVESGKKVVEAAFTMKAQDWQIWGTPPLLPAEERALKPEEVGVTSIIKPQERLLLPAEICDLGDGKWGWYTAEDFTHIVAADSVFAAGKAKSACGSQVSPKIIVSLKANVEPSCPVCAEVHRREYAAK